MPKLWLPLEGLPAAMLAAFDAEPYGEADDLPF